MRVVVCDDDPMLSQVICRLVDDIPGATTVGTVGMPLAAVELIERGKADVLVLDLSLAADRGETVLDELALRRIEVQTVVFSAYATDPAGLESRGVFAVVEKPDFERLEHVLSALAADRGPKREDGRERRRSRFHEARLPSTPPAGDDDQLPLFIETALECLSPGDTVIAMRLEPEQDGATMSDLVGVLRRQMRDHDRVVVTPDGDLVMFVVGTHIDAASSVWRRVDEAWDELDRLGNLVASYRVVNEAERTKDTYFRAVGAARGAEAGLSPA